jgi:hypothetical protein
VNARPLLVTCALALGAAAAAPAHAFPHVVRPGETLAQIAERTYGRIEMEQLLVAANGLDAGRGVPIVAGMRLEIPAVGHRRASASDTWPALAAEMLGDSERSDVLALANHSMPWLRPEDGQELVVPFNLRYVVAQGDSILTVAYRFLGERDKAWMLDRYNHLKGKDLHRGDVVLVPLTDLPLTPEGKAEAANAGALVRSEGAGSAREAQRKADTELPLLAADVRNGRYVDAVARANRLLPTGGGAGDLTKAQHAMVERQLVEAYVALDASGLAEAACAAWREADPSSVLDPVELSPKILRACTNAAIGSPHAPPPPPPASSALPSPSSAARAP